MEKNKGITLVALIITIIVMLILVAVSVNVIIKSNLIGTAEKTVDKYSKVVEEEGNLNGIKINGRNFNSYIPLPDIVAGERATENSNYNGAIIPKGFTISKAEGETTIDGGLVIYLIQDKTDEEIKELTWTGTELENLKKTYDQFVWVPVTDVNKMFMCQAKTADTTCNLKIEGNEVICQTHKTADATKSKKMAGRLYATDTNKPFDSSLTTQTYNSNSALREPAIVAGKYDETGTSYDKSESDNDIGLTLETLQTEYNNAVKKVIESKGFWIGRYETSGMSSNSSSDSTTILSVVAGKGTNDGINNVNWYRMYKQQQNYANQKSLDITKVQSTMVFGAAYDQTIMFANCVNKKTPAKDYSAVITGNVETDCFKNIYDLCDNVRELTTEAYYNLSRIERGGDFYYNYPACSRVNTGPTGVNNSIRL